MINFTTTPASKATPARTEMFPGVPHITHPVGQPYADINFFDVPAETYTAGNQTGIHVAAHLFKVARDVEEGFLLCSIRAACRLLEQADANGNTATVDKLGAAVGFLDMVEQLLNQACKQLDLPGLISANLELCEQAAAQDLREMREKNAALMVLITPVLQTESLPA